MIKVIFIDSIMLATASVKKQAVASSILIKRQPCASINAMSFLDTKSNSLCRLNAFLWESLKEEHHRYASKRHRKKDSSKKNCCDKRSISPRSNLPGVSMVLDCQAVLINLPIGVQSTG